MLLHTSIYLTVEGGGSSEAVVVYSVGAALAPPAVPAPPDAYVWSIG